ncbi:MAG TPA: DUF885 domain-containing protein [Trebonia sp.]|jgi:uncharacterized protein (DUF885 family)|nr:DUF885 domain-containing protein [Trebonia sp.]
MPSIDDVAAEYVERAAALDPFYATSAGIAGHSHELADLGADGFAGRAELDRSTLAALDAADSREPRQRVAGDAMRERLALAVERYDAGDTTSELNTLNSWVQRVREVFDLMPTDGEEAAANIAKRMAAVPRAYRQLSATLLDAARNGRCAARRQVEEVAGQCAAWARPGNSFYPGLAGHVTAVPDSLRRELAVAARAATAATAELGTFLDRELMPLAREKDACGAEVYARASRHFLGAAVDLREAYAWSWEELSRLRAEMAQVSNLVRPGATVEEAMAIVDEDPARRVEGRENFRAWMQEHAERTIAELHGTHFDIPQPAHRIEAVIAPTSDGGIYYTEPSEDWSRPGRMCWSVPDGIEAFSTWKEVTVVYHEGVPGHHLQVSHALAQRESLNRWQRMSWVSGHGEGWALYAERLMGDLGYLDDPGAYLGMLDSQQLLTAQVPLDIGVHLELDVPKGSGWHEGERWNAEIAWKLLRAHSSWDERQLRSELRRCLGLPGQAPSYKLGEQTWLQAREDAMARDGAAFSLKDFHAKALSLGAMGLDPLRKALARI